MIRLAGHRGPFQSKKQKPTVMVLDPAPFPETIALELAGKYVVWSPDGLRIVGNGSTMAEALEIAAIEDGRLIQRVPKALRAHTLGGTEPPTSEG